MDNRDKWVIKGQLSEVWRGPNVPFRGRTTHECTGISITVLQSCNLLVCHGCVGGIWSEAVLGNRHVKNKYNILYSTVHSRRCRVSHGPYVKLIIGFFWGKKKSGIQIRNVMGKEGRSFF